jgi:serine/threonine-protein kinase
VSETNALNVASSITGPTLSADVAGARTLDAAGHVFHERLGVGGMGEVYRCADGALQRDLAIKVLRAELHGAAGARERFLREARLTGSLEHPGIVPVHQLGQLADGRPCYTMKLVRGRTFADMLRAEPEGAERLPRLLAVVEKVCQAVAYAHSKGVIHRDLKPHNVMVGEFGEVQVMDWGLAKELSGDEPPAPSEATEKVETVARTEEGEGLSRAGLALGTPEYMPPEQAAGDWEVVDERADVFALGAILCAVLTGRPPYHGAGSAEVLRRARRGDTAEALARLETCGADAALVDLCRACLEVEPLGRPRHAGAVAERLAAYQAAVQERLRRAEVERAETEVRVREERKRRRLTLALAALVLLLVCGGGGAWWWRQQQLDRAERAVSNALAQADLLAAQARADPLQTDRYQQALDAARVAAQLAESATAEVRQRTQETTARLEGEAEAARKDRELLAALLDVRGPREGPKYHSDAHGALMVLAEPTADEQFAAAFRGWGVDVDGVSPAGAALLLKARPPAVVTELSAALDEWASERRRQGGANKDWQRLEELAALLDDDPGSKRRELRQILARGRLPLERALDVLSAALRPVPVPVEVPLGPDRTRLRQLADQTNAAREPTLGLLTLARALAVAGEEARAERLLRAAIVARPREVVLHHTLGQLLESQDPPRWAEAVECYAAARAWRPDLGVNLATALLNSGHTERGLALLAWLVRENPTSPHLHFQLANALRQQGRLNEEVAELHRTIALAPKLAPPHHNLGVALAAQGHGDQAVAEWHQAIALNPKLAPPHTALGAALAAKRQWHQAEAKHREAIALDPRYAPAHSNLGLALAAEGHLDEAVAEHRKAIGLEPKLAPAHANLAAALYASGQWDESIAECRRAIALDPKLACAHSSLGVALYFVKKRLDEAVAEWRQAVALDPNDAKTHTNLGVALSDMGQWDEAMAEWRQSIALDPNDAKAAHVNLGNALVAKRRFDDAVAECRKAVALDDKDAKVHTALGNALFARRSLDEAVAEYQKAIALDDKEAKAHVGFGNALFVEGRFDEAMAEYQKAIARDPTDAKARTGLATALAARGRLDEAVAEYQKAIARDPNYAQAHYNYGMALAAKGLLDEAVAEYRQAIRLNPDYADAHCNLGSVLKRQGRFDEALAFFRRGHALGSKQPGWPYPSAQWVRDAEQLMMLDRKLPAVLRGEGAPANPGEAVALAWMCQQPYKKRFAAAARLYADAFAAEPKLAEQYRYNGARSAVLAAAGQGEDARRLPDRVAAMFRRWALGWLRDDLQAYARFAQQNNPRLNQAIGERLAHWRRDADLASVRDPQSLGRLPENERAGWQALWRDVDRLANRVASKSD